MIICADISHLDFVKMITQETIKEIYPHYYPKGAVDFFCTHHNDENIEKDILAMNVFLINDNQHNIVGTITIKDNEICRLFILPNYQKKGFGSQLLDFAENKILNEYDTVVLDASLPAKSIYLKRGYKETSSHSIRTDSGDYLCYDVMHRVIK